MQLINTVQAKEYIKRADIRGYVRLVKEATLGITDIVQAMHHKVVHPPFLPSTPIQHAITGIADITYFNIKTTTQWIGGGLDKLASLFPSSDDDVSPGKRKDFLAILNGIIGDHMVKTKNPLAISMQFIHKGQKVDLPSPVLQDALSASKGKMMIMVHGLCGHDNRWEENEENPSSHLAEELNYMPVYLYFNSGLHISENGHQLNELMNELIRMLDTYIKEVVFIGHSMGGLVVRSCCHVAQEEKSDWLKRVSKIITLGTPHHGAPLEKLGNYIDHILEAIPYTQPLARLGKLRSAGITDLRYGSVIDHERGKRWHKRSLEYRYAVPLPEGVECYAIAASKTLEVNSAYGRLSGDGLVSVESALGVHRERSKNLDFPASNIYLCFATKHTQLLTSQEVFDQIKDWMLRE